MMRVLLTAVFFTALIGASFATGIVNVDQTRGGDILSMFASDGDMGGGGMGCVDGEMC